MWIKLFCSFYDIPSTKDRSCGPLGGGEGGGGLGGGGEGGGGLGGGGLGGGGEGGGGPGQSDYILSVVLMLGKHTLLQYSQIKVNLHVALHLLTNDYNRQP